MNRFLGSACMAIAGVLMLGTVLPANADPACPSEMTASALIQQGGFRLNRRLSHYVQTVQITNNSASTLEGQLYLTVEGLAPSVALANAVGTLDCGGGPTAAPYARIVSGNGSPMLPGEKRSLVLQFANPGNAAIRYTARLFAGPTGGVAASGVSIEPDAMPIGTVTQVTITANVPYPVTGLVPTVVVQRLDAADTVIGTDGSMVDNGNLGAGDEIGGDGVFTLRRNYSFAVAGDVRLRVRAELGGQVAYSAPFTLTAFTPQTDAEILATRALGTTSQQQYFALLSSNTPEQARATVVASLKSNALVQDAGSAPGQIWIIYKNGMHAMLLLQVGTKGGGSVLELPASTSKAPYWLAKAAAAASANPEVQSKRVLLLSPFVNEFGAGDEGSTLNSLYSSQSCPTYEGLNGKPVYLENAQAGVGAFKALGGYGIVHISSHSALLGSINKVVIATGTVDNLANAKLYAGDLQKLRLISVTTPTGAQIYAITPEFVTYYIKSFPDSLIFLSSCESTKNNTMVAALTARGAKTVLGFSEEVRPIDSFAKAVDFHKSWIEDPTTLVTAGDVYNDGVAKFSKCTPGPTAASPLTCWELAGSTMLAAPTGNQLQNGGFESGTLGAWTAAGDGRVLTQLGTFAPTAGSYLGLVSTGLGFTDTSGSIEQKVCLPASAKTLSFDWNFSSEEFREYCGSIYQDFFRVDLVAADGTVSNLFYRNVDQLCASTFKVPFSFDRGDVWSTGWTKTALDISAFVKANAGKSVTLRLSAGDVGDSIYDTAVLLDSIEVK